MSKIDTKGLGKSARNLAKAGKFPPGFALRPIQKPEPQPRVAGRFTRPAEDARKVALNARCRRYGVAANSANRELVDKVHMCCGLGFVMQAMCKREEVSELWDVFARWTRAEVAYRTRYIGQGEQPASAALVMIPEIVTTDQSHTVDVRTPEERDRDAVKAWMHWQGRLGRLSRDMQAVLHAARRDDGAKLWHHSKPTASGMLALEALRLLAREG